MMVNFKLDLNVAYKISFFIEIFILIIIIDLLTTNSKNLTC